MCCHPIARALASRSPTRSSGVIRSNQAAASSTACPAKSCATGPGKIIIHVPVEESVLTALRAPGRHTFEVLLPPGETARALPPELLAETEVLFCTIPPSNHAAMRKLRWVQVASTGYNQLFGLDLPARGVI